MCCFNSVEYKMNGIINRFLLAGYRCMPEMHLKQPAVFKIKNNLYSLTLLVVLSLEINKEFRNLCKQEIQTTFTENN